MRYTSLRVHSKQKFQKYDDFTFCTEDTRCSECGWKLRDIRSLVFRIPQQGCPSPTIEGRCDQVSFKSFFFKQRTILVFRIPQQGCPSSAIEGMYHLSLKNRIGGFNPSFCFKQRRIIKIDISVKLWLLIRIMNISNSRWQSRLRAFRQLIISP